MSKKTLLLLAILGIVLIIIGIFYSPEFLGTSRIGKNADWKNLKASILGFYAIVIGGILIFDTLLISKIPTERRLKFYVGSSVLLGIGMIITSLILTPAFSIEHFTPLNYLNKQGHGRLLFFQLLFILIGWLLIFIPSSIYFIKHIKSFKLFFVTFILGFFTFLILFQVTYINTKYPSNIILKPSEYSKVLELVLGNDILLSDFEPKSTLKVKRRKVVKAKYPAIDFNAHLSSSFRTEYDKKVLAPENLIKSMDSVGLRIVINTDVENGDLEKVLNKYSRKYPDRFMNLWPTGFPAGVMTDERIAELPGELERAIKMGAVGDGELWKNLGLKTKDTSGKVIPVDDPRLDPLWAKAGELGVPILWHMGDPAAMFQPIDKFNERFTELRSYPEWSYYGPKFPSRETIMKGRENVLRKHPNTIIIGCHMGWNVDNLEYAGYLLDTYPNYYLDMSTTLSELGRQPYTTRRFFIKYQDRIVFGTDGGSLYGVKGWTVEKFYQAHWEFLETDNEYIDYPMKGAINQGNWKIYGIHLPDSVLQKIYYKNAAKILKIKIDE
jgi:predicted TIM-barrel fold metal-dependent hydrolase